MLSFALIAAVLSVAPGDDLNAAVAALRGTGGTIVLADGLYELAEPLALTSVDSNLVFKAADGARPVLSGGRRIRDWTVDGRGWWHARVEPGSAAFGFFADGVRRSRPYRPRARYHAFAADAGPDPATGNYRFVWKGEDVDPRWNDLRTIEAHVFYVWDSARYPILSADAQTRTVTLNHKDIGGRDNYPFGRGTCYRLDNVRAALGEAEGEWYLDRTGELTYVPRVGETPGKTETVLSRLTNVVTVDGAVNVAFRGVTFAHSNWALPPDGLENFQACPGMPAAILVANSSGVVFEMCEVVHAAGWAISMAHGNRNCAVRYCELADLGAGGVRIGPGREWTGERSALTSGCVVEDCLIEDGGRVNPAGCGIWIGHASGNRIAHNTIRRMYYSGISCGWTWGFDEQGCSDNVIEWNDISEIGQRVLSDMAGIYMLGRQPGTVLRFNRIREVRARAADGNGIYFDSGASGIVCSNNAVRGVSGAGFFLQYLAATNLVANNVFAYSDDVQIRTPKGQPGYIPTRFERNVITFGKSATLRSEGYSDELIAKDNVFWNPGGTAVAIPGFASADPRDAGRFGFRRFSLAGVGRRCDPDKTRSRPAVPPVFTAVMPQDEPVNLDFERLPVGPCTGAIDLYPATATNLVRVVDSTCAAGRRSLEVVDSSDGWLPHFCVEPYLSGGRISVSVLVMAERAARPEVELRTRTYDYRPSNPRIGIVDGVAFANGVEIARIPERSWVRVVFEIAVDRAQASDTWTARVETADGAVLGECGTLPLNPAFDRIGWIGFLSNAPGNGSRYWVGCISADRCER